MGIQTEHEAMGWLGDGFDVAQQWLFESVLQPVMFAVGLGSQLENGYKAAGWVLVGLLQLLVIVAVIGPLQRWRPVEPVTDRATIRTDILYTLIHRLGLFRLGLFLAVDPLMDSLFGTLRVAGISTFQLDGLWPGVTDVPWVSLLLGDYDYALLSAPARQQVLVGPYLSSLRAVQLLNPAVVEFRVQFGDPGAL